MNVVVIERVADPLPGGRAQLVEHVFVDGEQDVALNVPARVAGAVGSRARARGDADDRRRGREADGMSAGAVAQLVVDLAQTGAIAALVAAVWCLRRG